MLSKNWMRLYYIFSNQNKNNIPTNFQSGGNQVEAIQLMINERRKARVIQKQ